MCDTIWEGRIQKLVDDNGIPKGLKKVFEERDINTKTMLCEDVDCFGSAQGLLNGDATGMHGTM